MTGKRLHPPAGFFVYQCDPGDYYREADTGDWRGKTPNDLCVLLRNHHVEEHEDGTVTVDPSILTRNGVGTKTWHGYLERGVWRQV